jgi:2-polyprenyl-3-methyl-5-hydroxy-6-metoxy-1,4-benzoquinol methylase
VIDTKYSQHFVDLVLQTCPEDWTPEAFLRVHLDGPQSRLEDFKRFALPELEFHCGSLDGKRVLEIGCGKGAATVSLARGASEVLAFDIDETSARVCEARTREHEIGNVTVRHTQSFSEIAGDAGTFDVVVLHAVLEHVPRTIPGLRESVIRSSFDAVKLDGYLFVFETPNRLWPRDIHTTGLWLLPWTPAGSPRAYRRAVNAGVHRDRSDITPGPRGLEERGAWGLTYWEIRRALPPGEYSVVNLQPGHDRRAMYCREAGIKRTAFESLVYWTATRTIRAPIAAFTPMFSPLVFRRSRVSQPAG